MDVFRLACLISDLSSLPSLLGAHGFRIGNKGGTGPGFRQHMGGNGGISNGNSIGAGGGQGGWNQHCWGHRHLGGQMSSQHRGGGGGGSSGGGRGGKNDRGTVEDNAADMAAREGSSRHYMWREEQIGTSSDPGKESSGGDK